MDEQPVFTLHTDAERIRVTVDRWTPTMLLHPSLLNTEANGSSITIEDGLVRFAVANGAALYRITGWKREAQALTLTLLESHGPT